MLTLSAPPPHTEATPPSHVPTPCTVEQLFSHCLNIRAVPKKVSYYNEYTVYSGEFSVVKIFVVQQDLVSVWFIYSWLLLALQVKVGKVTSFVGKIFVFQCSTTNIFATQNYPLYGSSFHRLFCVC